MPIERKPALPTSYIPRIQSVLEGCDELRNPNSLYDLFSLYEELLPWRDNLREGHSPRERVRSVMAYLSRNHLSNGDNALVVLLKLLSESYSAQDRRSQDLMALANELEPIMRIAPNQQSQSTNQITSELHQIDFLIVAPLKEEREAILKELQIEQPLPPFNNDIHTYYETKLSTSFPNGETGEYRIVVTSPPQIGRTYAGFTTAQGIAQWNPRYVLLVGIAGGVPNMNIKIGDILIARQIADYSLQKNRDETTEIRWEFYCPDPRLLIATQNLSKNIWLPNMPRDRPGSGEPELHIGVVASGDKSIASAKIIAEYSSTLPKLVGVEMEAGGVAVGSFLQVKPVNFFMIRAVSDLADENESSEEVNNWRSYACAAAAAYTFSLLKSGPIPCN